MNSLHANDVTAIIVVISIVAVIALWFYKISKSNKKLTKEYNIKHKTNFKTYSDLMNYIWGLREKERAKLEAKEREEKAKREALQQEEKRQEKERQKEERITATEPSSSDLGARLKKLRQMYKDGILSKVEFEKAKNKLLKWPNAFYDLGDGVVVNRNWLLD